MEHKAIDKTTVRRFFVSVSHLEARVGSFWAFYEIILHCVCNTLEHCLNHCFQYSNSTRLHVIKISASTATCLSECFLNAFVGAQRLRWRSTPGRDIDSRDCPPVWSFLFRAYWVRFGATCLATCWGRGDDVHGALLIIGLLSLTTSRRASGSSVDNVPAGSCQ